MAPEEPSTPSSVDSFLISSSLCRIRSSKVSRSSERSTLVSKSRSLSRVSSNLRSGSTCWTTWPGVKSSIELNLSWTGISLPSPLSVFATRNSRPGVMRAMTSLKLSRSIPMNFRSLRGLNGAVVLPEKSPSTPTTNGSSFRTTAPSVSTL